MARFNNSEPGAIVNAYSGLVLGDPGYSTSNGTGLVQWQWTGGPNEQWTLVAAGDAPAVTYYIVNAASGKVLDDPRARPATGTIIDQWQLNGGANQRWTLVPLANGNYLIVNEASGLVLDDPRLDQSGPHRSVAAQRRLNQQWQFTLGLSLTGRRTAAGDNQRV